jgi:hypothetical protein
MTHILSFSATSIDDLYALALTCRHCKDLVLNSRNLSMIGFSNMKRFVEEEFEIMNFEAFAQVLLRTGSVIHGSFPLQCLTGTLASDSDIDIYTPSAEADQEIRDFLLYNFYSTQKLKHSFRPHSVLRGDPPGMGEDGLPEIDYVHDPLMPLSVEKVTTLVIMKFVSEELYSVVNPAYQRRYGRDYEYDHGKTRSIQLIQIRSDQHPMHVVDSFDLGLCQVSIRIKERVPYAQGIPIMTHEEGIVIGNVSAVCISDVYNKRIRVNKRFERAVEDVYQAFRGEVLSTPIHPAAFNVKFVKIMQRVLKVNNNVKVVLYFMFV